MDMLHILIHFTIQWLHFSSVFSAENFRFESACGLSTFDVTLGYQDIGILFNNSLSKIQCARYCVESNEKDISSTSKCVGLNICDASAGSVCELLYRENVNDVADCRAMNFNPGCTFFHFMTEVWPKGIFSLSMPTYDCPEDWLSDSSTLYMQIGGNTNYSVGNHIQKQQGGNVSNDVVNIPGCQKISAFGTYDWPAGDYCIIAVKCPPDFYPGHIGLHEEGDYIYHFYFCCRNDGLSSAPIKLPTTMPFYLYRFWGECQQVMDMTVTEEYIHFDTKDNQNSDEFYGSFAFVIVTTDYVDLRFCYYE